jgi:hypothetical protein
MKRMKIKFYRKKNLNNNEIVKTNVKNGPKQQQKIGIKFERIKNGRGGIKKYL